MASDWRLNGFLDADKFAALYDEVERRASCRSFAGAPTTEQWNALMALTDAVALRGVRIVLGMCDPTLFQPRGLQRFINVRRYAAVVTTDDLPRSVVNGGVSGETLLLSAVQLGLAGCWVDGCYDPERLTLPLADGEALLALIPLGMPQDAPSPKLKRKRKPLNELCRPSFDALPMAFRDVALCVRSAPSSLNAQPWTMTLESETELSVSVPSDVERVDLGIAMCHAALALGKTRALYSLGDDGLRARIEL